MQMFFGSPANIATVSNEQHGVQPSARKIKPSLLTKNKDRTFPPGEKLEGATWDSSPPRSGVCKKYRE
ncbi:hypothetical protein KIN20_011911 [Parelaphostrongylus tenuis]|uniref:Uncharacterized protein n=1 Tax=Parelaphostrongylus tenuis TaxID=148309 RepID=A0AAD5MBG7_PARTN|nr:hypothetical protein KIN20_011911 [Parelaphostrongylus tenuis]